MNDGDVEETATGLYATITSLTYAGGKVLANLY